MYRQNLSAGSGLMQADWQSSTLGATDSGYWGAAATASLASDVGTGSAVAGGDLAFGSATLMANEAGLGTSYAEAGMASATPYTETASETAVVGATFAGGFDSVYGYGLVDAAAAVSQALSLYRHTFPDVDNLREMTWGNDAVNAPEVWQQGYTGHGIVVAVIDDGVDINHEDLQQNIWRNPYEIENNGIDDDANGYVDDIYGWNFGIGEYNNDVRPGGPNNDHGTHVAGTIAAANNGIGMTGVAYNAQIMALRMGTGNEEGGFVNAGNLAEAIRYAVDNGARVINMSLGWTDSAELRAAFAYAADHHVITITSAGNASEPAPGVPANYAVDYGISVGAVDRFGQIADFSNWAGTNPHMQHVVAPGVEVYSTLPDNAYGYKDGTSMAAPHVAGVVALMLSANPYLTASDVREILTSTAMDPTDMSVF
jgi:subtilisin